MAGSPYLPSTSVFPPLTGSIQRPMTLSQLVGKVMDQPGVPPVKTVYGGDHDFEELVRLGLTQNDAFSLDEHKRAWLLAYLKSYPPQPSLTGMTPSLASTYLKDYLGKVLSEAMMKQFTVATSRPMSPTRRAASPSRRALSPSRVATVKPALSDAVSQLTREIDVLARTIDVLRTSTMSRSDIDVLKGLHTKLVLQKAALQTM
jgi:hypothetical protein